MNRILIYALIAASIAGGVWGYGAWKYASGWDEGRQKLITEQQEKERQRQAKLATRQQANDTKAAAADSEGKTKTEVITREVIKYVSKASSADRGGLGAKCSFDAERVRIKADAADNAASIPGFDDSSVQTDAAKR